MISDQTNARTTFALATQRPFIQCMFNTSSLNKTDESDLGVKLYDINELITTTKKVLNNLDSYKKRIHNHSNNILANKGNSLKYLSDTIDFIIDNKQNQNWFYFDKGKINKKEITIAKDYIPYINYFVSTTVNYSQWSWRICLSALNKFPDNAMLLALYAKILFIKGENDLAIKIREKAYSIDKYIAAKYIWGDITLNISTNKPTNNSIKEKLYSIIHIIKYRIKSKINNFLIKIGGSYE